MKTRGYLSQISNTIVIYFKAFFALNNQIETTCHVIIDLVFDNVRGERGADAMMTLCNFERKTRANLLLASLLKIKSLRSPKNIPLKKVIIDWVDAGKKLVN